VVLIVEYDIGYVCDCSGVVCGAVNIVDRDWLGKGACGDIIELCPLDVNEAAQSMRACMYHFTMVSIDLISTSTRRDIGPGLSATTYLTGN
jgi:hypothetical protein